MADTDRALWDDDPDRDPEAEAALEAEPLLRPVWDDPSGPPHPAWLDGAPTLPRHRRPRVVRPSRQALGAQGRGISHVWDF